MELRSKGFHGTSLIFPVNWNYLIANIEMKREMISGPIDNFPIDFYIGYKGISVYGKN